ERSLPPRREANQFVTEARDNRKEEDAGGKLSREAVDRDKRIHQHRDHHDDQQETGAAARMEGSERLRVRNSYGFARLVVKDNLMLGPVILEDAPDILHSRNPKQESEEDGDAQRSVDHIDREIAMQERVTAADPFRELQRDELI